MEHFVLLTAHLPQQFRNELQHSQDTDSEYYTVRSNLNTMADIIEWVRAFGAASNTKWIAGKSTPKGQRIVCRKEYLCHHSNKNKVDPDKNRRGLSKNTKCSAQLKVVIKLDTSNTRGTDPYVKDKLCAVIKISKQHNHTLSTAQALRFLNSELRDVFNEYFNDGMTAAEAAHFHRDSLSLRDDITEADMANPRRNPTDRTVKYWFSVWREKNFGSRSSSAFIDKLKERCNDCQKIGATIKYTENPFAVLIVTPIMKRAHRLPMSSQFVFINSTTSFDADNYSLTFLLTPCPAGVAPLGILITKGQSADVYSNAFSLIKNHIEYAFLNNGYPKFFITDDSAAVITAAKTIWPESSNFLSIFYCLKSVWRWIWCTEHQISEDHRVELMDAFKKMLYAEDLPSLEDAYRICLECGDKYNYDQWKKYINTHYWPRKEKWALPYRDASSRDYHINNFAETSICLYKDIVLSRIKSLNVISLIDFCCKNLDDAYIKKFCNFANFRIRDLYTFFQTLISKTKYVDKDDIIALSDVIYLVPSQTDKSDLYTVDVETGCCSCMIGMHGKICKHQCAVYRNFNVTMKNFPPVNAADRCLVAKLAFGEKVPDMSFYKDFQLDIINTSNNIVEVSEVDEEILLEIPLSQVDEMQSITINPENTDDNFETILECLVDDLQTKIRRFKSSSTIDSMNCFRKQINKIGSEGLLDVFLRSSMKPFITNTRTNVQTTSVSRRRSTLGSTRKIASGRVAKRR